MKAVSIILNRIIYAGALLFLACRADTPAPQDKTTPVAEAPVAVVQTDTTFSYLVDTFVIDKTEQLKMPVSVDVDKDGIADSVWMNEYHGDEHLLQLNIALKGDGHKIFRNYFRIGVADALSISNTPDGFKIKTSHFSDWEEYNIYLKNKRFYIYRVARFASNGTIDNKPVEIPGHTYQVADTLIPLSKATIFNNIITRRTFVHSPKRIAVFVHKK